MVDGHGLAATERRLKALRDVQAAALPGKSLVVYEPAHGLVTNVFPCEDGHAQERSWCGAVRTTVQAGERWIADRNFCPREFLWTIDQHGAYCIIRQHAGLPFDMVTPWRGVGRIETGHVAEQQVRVVDAHGEAPVCRRVQIPFDEATRDGDRLLYLLTNVPRQRVSTKRVARFYRKRWTLETAFQHLEASLHAEINTLGYPKAAFCGFCLALVAYHVFAVVLAALRGVHGECTVEHEVSGHYVANAIDETSKGMMSAIPEAEWDVFWTMSMADMAATLRDLAARVRLDAMRQSPRRPKKPRPKHQRGSKKGHVSTAKLLSNRKSNLVAP
jgi:hypothetical protein